MRANSVMRRTRKAKMSNRRRAVQLPARKNNRIASLVRDHHKSLTVLGGLVIFITFIVKETVRDHLKDLADSINKSESVITDAQTLHIALGLFDQLVHASDNTLAEIRDWRTSEDRRRTIDAGTHHSPAQHPPFVEFVDQASDHDLMMVGLRIAMAQEQ